MDPNSVIIEVKPPTNNKIVIEDEFIEKRAIELAKAFGNKDIESLQNFKQDIEKMNNGQMDYA